MPNLKPIIAASLLALSLTACGTGTITATPAPRTPTTSAEVCPAIAAQSNLFFELTGFEEVLKTKGSTAFEFPITAEICKDGECNKGEGFLIPRETVLTDPSTDSDSAGKLVGVITDFSNGNPKAGEYDVSFTVTVGNKPYSTKEPLRVAFVDKKTGTEECPILSTEASVTDDQANLT